MLPNRIWAKTLTTLLLAILVGLPLGHGWGEQSPFGIARDGVAQLSVSHSAPDSVRPDPVQITSIVRNDGTGSDDGRPAVLSEVRSIPAHFGLPEFTASACLVPMPDTCPIGTAAPRAPPLA